MGIIELVLSELEPYARKYSAAHILCHAYEAYVIAELPDALCLVVKDVERIRRIGDIAGVKSSLVDQEKRALDQWESLLDQASAEGKLHQLITQTYEHLRRCRQKRLVEVIESYAELAKLARTPEEQGQGAILKRHLLEQIWVLCAKKPGTEQILRWLDYIHEISLDAGIREGIGRIIDWYLPDDVIVPPPASPWTLSVDFASHKVTTAGKNVHWIYTRPGVLVAWVQDPPNTVQPISRPPFTTPSTDGAEVRPPTAFSIEHLGERLQDFSFEEPHQGSLIWTGLQSEYSFF